MHNMIFMLHVQHAHIFYGKTTYFVFLKYISENVGEILCEVEVQSSFLPWKEQLSKQYHPMVYVVLCFGVLAEEL